MYDLSSVGRNVERVTGVEGGGAGGRASGESGTVSCIGREQEDVVRAGEEGGTGGRQCSGGSTIDRYASA